MNVRVTTINDAEGVLNVQKKTWLKTYPCKEHNITKEDITARFANKEERIARIKNKVKKYDKDSCGWVVELNKDIVAFSAVQREMGESTIKAIYVLPEYQGKGFGKRLMQQIFDFFKESKEIYLEVASYNKDAIAFYKKHNFDIIPDFEGKHEVFDGKFIPTIKMRREHLF